VKAESGGGGGSRVKRGEGRGACGEWRVACGEVADGGWRMKKPKLKEEG
jgi:hypothetical protein